MLQSYIFLILALIFNAGANIFAKVGMNKIGKIDDGSTIIIKIINSPYIILAVILFAINFGFYAMALFKINLSVAYPIMVGLGFVIIILVSWLFLGENITFIQMFGIMLILIGVLLISK